MYHSSNTIHPTAVIYDGVEIGKNNIIGAGAVIGIPGAVRGDLNYNGKVIIGDNNFIGANGVIVAGYEGPTTIGDDNIIMNLVNIGHDAVISDSCEIGVGTVVCGYCHIEKGVKIKVGCKIRNRIKIAPYVLIGMGSVVVKNIYEPAKTYIGVPARCQ